MSVAVLLSTYNGEKFLREQLDSIFSQTYKNFIIYVRDDGSIDDTILILNEFGSKYPSKIVLLDQGGRNLGVVKSFQYLIEKVDANLYFFADHDDIWDYNKLEVMTSAYTRSSKQELGKLIICNSIFFDERNNFKINFFDKIKLNQEKLNNKLFRSSIPGCTMMFDRFIRDKLLDLNLITYHLHDTQILYLSNLIASVELVNLPLISHRIHSRNVIGLGSDQPLSIYIKDFIKYFKGSKEYRAIACKEYFDYVQLLKPKFLDAELKLKELYDINQVCSLGFINRKRWYLKHFNPFEKGILKGSLLVLTF